MKENLNEKLNEQNKIKINPTFVVFLVGILMTTAIYFSQAIWFEEEAVHIVPDEIETSTLIIGSHLIHLSSLNDSLYEVAMVTAEESGQLRMYYKSELAEDTWFDITTATTLVDITTGGTPVPVSEIELIFFTHHTKSDGITIDLRTNLPVSLVDIIDPYGIIALPEMYPLKLQYESFTRQSGEDDDAGDVGEKGLRLKTLLEFDPQNSDTDQLDGQISGLQGYYEVLASNNAPSDEMGVVQEVMDAVDAARRFLVFTLVEEELNEYIDELMTSSTVDTVLQSAASESLSNVQTSIIEHSGKMLVEGDTGYGITYYNLAQDLISQGESNNHSACDVTVAKILDLEHIQGDSVVNKATELDLLEQTLIPLVTGEYTSGLSRGINADYIQAVSSNSANALLNTIASTNKNEVNAWRSELEFYIQGRIDRAANDEASSYLEGRLTLTQGWYSQIPADGFRDSITETVDNHVIFLTRLLRELELAAGGNELDQLLVEKAELQTDLLYALDNNDLAEAKAVEESITALDDQISSIETEISAELFDLQEELSALESAMAEATAEGNEDLAQRLNVERASVNADIALINASLTEGSLGATVVDIQEAANNLLSQDNLSNDQLNQLNITVDSLCDLLDMDYGTVFPILKDLHNEMTLDQALNGGNQFDEALASIEEAILENISGYSSDKSTEKSADDLSAIADSFLGDTPSGFLDSGNDILGDGFSSVSSTTGTGTGTGDFGTGTGTGGSGTGTGTGDSGTGTGADGSGTGTGDSTSGFGDTPFGLDSGFGSGSGLVHLLDQGSNGDSIVYLLALQMYFDETKSAEVLQMIAAQGRREMELGNPLIYQRYDLAGYEFIPLEPLSAYTGYRHVWNQNNRTESLVYGGICYDFKSYSAVVGRGSSAEDSDLMSQSAKVQNGIHVVESYTESSFGIWAVYLSQTNYGIAVNEAIQLEAEGLFAQFLS